MSGIFGIYHPDNRQINPTHIQQMAKSSAHRGPDGTNIFQQQPIAFGHSMLQTTPESVFEKLPFFDTESGLVITSDARLDNRKDLANKLFHHNIAGIPDSQLILSAYKKWGINSFTNLIGDFSFAIWDARNKQLICVRDYIGVKPFYYHHSAAQFLFSSEIKQLAEHSDVQLTINEGTVGEYLSHSHSNKTETLFKDINRLSPGNYLIIKEGTVTIHQYWSWNPKKQLSYKNTSEYTDHFLEIFEQAVKSRLRSNGIVSAELSGGLDSSSVVGMANKLSLNTNYPKIQFYSMTFPRLKCDEKSHIENVTKYHRINTNYINCRDHIFSTYQEQTEYTFEPPDPPNLLMTTPLIEAVKQNKSRVILSGMGGDEFFTGTGKPYLDHLRQWRLLSLAQEFSYQCKKNLYSSCKGIGLNLAWPLVPQTLRYILTKRAAKENIPAWLSNDFVTRSNLIERIHSSDPRISLDNLGRLSHSHIILDSREQYSLETLDRRRAHQQIEVRHPFLDQRIAEFAISLPDYINQKEGQIKFLLRNHKNYLLPNATKRRMDKAEFSYIGNQAFQQTLFPMINNQQLPIIEMGWVDKKRFTVAISTKRNAISKDKYTSGRKSWELWFAFSVNLWCNVIIKKVGHITKKT